MSRNAKPMLGAQVSQDFYNDCMNRAGDESISLAEWVRRAAREKLARPSTPYDPSFFAHNTQNTEQHVGQTHIPETKVA